ncbi:MAG: MarR family transcriptional regulator [Deltaproteobacteria bacterium]|nr:MAG: MarR family transcriptional regulator [Deltaproteobacteria bacterium]
MYSHEEFIVFLLAKANQKAQKMLKQHLKEFGLTPVQGLILEALFFEDGLTAGEIGKRLILDNATVSGVLDRLAEAGWVHKTQDAEDRRVLRVVLADKAKDNAEEMMVARNQTAEALLRTFSSEEQVLLKRLLRDLY